LAANRHFTSSPAFFILTLELRVPLYGRKRREEKAMHTRIVGLCSAAVFAFALILSTSSMTRAGGDDGIVRVKSAYSVAESVRRLKKDISDKGIKFFIEVDQAKLAAESGIPLNPSTLLEFGNPPLGTQFITSNPNAGLDWPVRLLIMQDDKGDVWAVYTDFDWIARRHGIKDRDAQFKMASSVIASITSSIRSR
jgi:uncharacterized protein (DUF302 family)